MRGWGTALAGLTGLTLVLTANPAFAAYDGTTTRDGLQTGVTNIELDRLKNGLDYRTGKPDTRSFEYKSEFSCSNDPNAAADVCLGTDMYCTGNTPEEGQGPPVMLLRREIDAKGTGITGWDPIDITCFPEQVPGKLVPSLSRIQTEFRITPFALPTVHIQPEGNLTLVTLPAFFEVTWPEAGFKPGEIHTVKLLGTEVQIRPTLESYTYAFGDGTSFGPTGSAGGPYPNGDITHAYPRAGTYQTRIHVTYSGEYKLEGGDWRLIHASAVVDGPEQTLTVKTARARLVTR